MPQLDAHACFRPPGSLCPSRLFSLLVCRAAAAAIPCPIHLVARLGTRSTFTRARGDTPSQPRRVSYPPTFLSSPLTTSSSLDTQPRRRVGTAAAEARHSSVWPAVPLVTSINEPASGVPGLKEGSIRTTSSLPFLLWCSPGCLIGHPLGLGDLARGSKGVFRAVCCTYLMLTGVFSNKHADQGWTNDGTAVTVTIHGRASSVIHAYSCNTLRTDPSIRSVYGRTKT